jgi:outer membrane lipoprotein-sorting protein
MKSADLANHRRRAAFGASAGFLFVLIAAVAIAAAGCNGAGATSPPAGGNKDGDKKEDAGKNDKKDTRTAQQVLNDMQATYRKADRYADEAKLHRYYTRGGDTFEQMFRHEVAFERPNKLRLECYDAKFISDGQHCFATVPHVPDVVMKVPAPEKLSPNDVVKDPQLQQALMIDAPAGPPITLLLLMQENGLEQLIRDAMAPPKLLEQETTDGRKCDRVELDSQLGKIVFWIDPATNMLVRLDWPPLLSKSWEQAGEKTTGLTVTFVKSQFDPKFPAETFKFDIPPGTREANTLVPLLQSTAAAPRSEPTSLKLTKLWSAADVKNPGNVLVIEQADGTPKIFTIDGSRTVIELDLEGKVVAKHELDLPEATLVTYLRSDVDKQGKRYFAVSAFGQPQVHVFDENWKKLFSFPKPEDAPEAQLTNVLIEDLVGDGTPELCVGYFGQIGLQGVSLTGNRLWSQRNFEYVQPWAVTEPDAGGKRRLLCTHQKGSIVLFNHDGEAPEDFSVPGRFIGVLAGADLEGAGKNSYCALGYSEQYNNSAMGISLDRREELWLYDLPDGAPGRPVEMVTAADVAGDGKKEWLIAAPDSSVHILQADGKLLDKFNHGTALCGLAGAKLAGKQVLLISSALEKPEGDAHSVLEAWQVEPVK